MPWVTAIVWHSSAAYAQQPANPRTSTVEAAQEPSGDRGWVCRQSYGASPMRCRLDERLNGDIDGWYPRLGGMTRGSGFALGPGYRTHVFGGPIFVDVSAGISIKRYQAADANVRWLQAFGERLELWTDFRYEHFPQEDFYGMGLDSSRDNETSYDFDSTDFVLRGLVKPVSWVRLGTTFGYMRPEDWPWHR